MPIPHPTPDALRTRSRIVTATNLVLGVLMFALLFMPTRWPYVTALRYIDAPILIITSVLAWRLDRKRRQHPSPRFPS